MGLCLHSQFPPPPKCTHGVLVHITRIYIYTYTHTVYMLGEGDNSPQLYTCTHILTHTHTYSHSMDFSLHLHSLHAMHLFNVCGVWVVVRVMVGVGVRGGLWGSPICPTYIYCIFSINLRHERESYCTLHTTCSVLFHSQHILRRHSEYA